MPLHVELAQSALGELGRLSGALKQRAVDLLVGLEGNPKPEGAQPCPGLDSVYRLKTGEFRVLYEVRNKVLQVLDLRLVVRRGR